MPMDDRRRRLQPGLGAEGPFALLPLALCLAAALAPSLRAEEGDLVLPQRFEAFDVPGDNGTGVGLSWSASPDDRDGVLYIVAEGPSPDGPFEEIKRVPSHRNYQADEPAVFGPFNPWNKKDAHYVEVDGRFDDHGKPVRSYYRLAISDGERTAAFPSAVTALPRVNYLKWHKLNNLVVALLCCVFTFFSIQRAKKNPHLYIRKLPGLEAIDEAVGRATEMGKPITYLTGSYDIDSISTIASVNILAHVARKVADYDSRLIVPCKWSVAMTVCQETVREAYVNAGRPDAYNPNDVFYVAGEQFSYTAAVDGILVRERPAANFLLGTFAAEALILAETGASTGAIQIAGTDSFYQIPFFVVCCDYCLIGEELYAASAYLSREPRLLGTLKGQDAGKMALVAAILIAAAGLILAQATGVDWWRNLALALQPM